MSYPTKAVAMKAAKAMSKKHGVHFSVYKCAWCLCGNIMGAIYGYEDMNRKRLFCPQGKELEQTLELSNIILTLADDLYTSCIISEYAPLTHRKSVSSMNVIVI